jgi:hypothetical protein
MKNLWCLEKNSILPLIISATGIVAQSLFKNLKSQSNNNNNNNKSSIYIILKIM